MCRVQFGCMFSKGARDQLYLTQKIGGMYLVKGEDSETREIGSLRKYFAATIDIHKILRGNATYCSRM